MCSVTIKNPEQYKWFILYNHLHAREDTHFTAEELQEEMLVKYHLNFSLPVLNNELINMVRNGLLLRGVNCYTRAAIF